jgi:hypothetical protein
MPSLQRGSVVKKNGASRKPLPERSAWAIHKALRHVLHCGVRVKLLDERRVSRPQP